MILLTIVSLLLIWCLIRCYQWWRNVFQHLEKLPGPRWYPLIGTAYLYIGIPKTDIFQKAIKIAEKYKPMFRLWLGFIPEVILLRLEEVEVVMKSTTLLSKGKHYGLLSPWLGEGLLLSTGPKWHLHRKLITPAFHFKNLESFMEVFVDKSNLLVKQLEGNADGRFFNIYPYITNCTLDIICETAMGVSVNAMSNKQSDYVKSINEVSELMMWRTFRPLLWWNPLFYITPQGRRFNKAINTLHGFSNRLIAERKKLFHEKKLSQKEVEIEVFGQKKRMSFIDLLLEASEDEKLLTDTDIREEVDTFIFEGHDTTTAAISWCLLLLGNNLEVQEKVFEEVRSVLQGKPIPTTLGDLHELKYLECVIKEALRLYPSVPVVIRSLTEDVMLGEYKIPAGTQAVLNIYYVHRDPTHYPEPEKFNPDRFLPENLKERHPYSYVPFSAGSRNCVGQKFAMYEEKTLLASIINHYKVVSEKTMAETKIFLDIVMRPQGGANLKFEKRYF